MIQEIFKGTISAEAAAGFVGLLSLFNMGGRFFWSSASDYIGRKNTYRLSRREVSSLQVASFLGVCG
jgi:hypothetical protein